MRRNTGKVKYRAAGLGSSEHLSGVAFGKAPRLDMIFVRHEGGGVVALNATIKGDLDWCTINAATAAPAVQSNRRTEGSGPQVPRGRKGPLPKQTAQSCKKY